MANYVKSIRCERVYGRLDFELHFEPGINVIHGKNGEGKTTLLHILANTLNGDFVRFAFLRFRSIEISLQSGDNITISRVGSNSRERRINVQINDKTVFEEPARELLRLGITPRILPAHERSEQLQLPLFGTDPEMREMIQRSLLSVSYFPAFRTMIEAWTGLQEDEAEYRRYRAVERYVTTLEDELRQLGLPGFESRYQAHLTYEARRAFGDFVPLVNYRSPGEIARSLRDEFQRALLIVRTQESQLFSRVFVEVISALSQTPTSDQKTSEKILEEIQHILSEEIQQWPIQDQIDEPESRIRGNTYDRLRLSVQRIQLRPEARDLAVPILDIYLKSLQERVEVQAKAFKDIEMYLKSVNDFLEGKELAFLAERRRGIPAVGVKFSDGSFIDGFRALSSGERQIVTLVYSATHMSSEQLVLIDEPEISLHIDWQRSLLKKMAEQLGGRQIIVCTHSPSIGADYLDNMIALKSIYQVDIDPKSSAQNLAEFNEDASSYNQ